MCLYVNELYAKLHIMCDLAKLLNKKNMDSMEKYYQEKANEVMEDVEELMRDYMKKRPNLTYEVETLTEGDFLFILAHCATDDNKPFSCAYFMGCYRLSGSKMIYENRNVLDNKLYTMADVVNAAKNHIAHLNSELQLIATPVAAINLVNKHILETRTEYGQCPRIVCADGFNLSVQASSGHYCSPRSDKGVYTKVEVGYPSQEEELLLPYAEDETRPTNTVYVYVPVELVVSIIEKHGGIA